MAKTEKNDYLVALATSNYIREALPFADDKEFNSLLNMLHDKCKDRTERDIQMIYKETLERAGNLKQPPISTSYKK